MRKRYILFSIVLIILAILTFNTKTYAADLDLIENYVVTVDPRMNDGSLDIIYEITWKVLDSTTEGPLTWVKIGTPNENFDTATALTKNIKSIKKYSGSYVRIDFTKSYTAGEQFTFKYSIHQPYMYKISWGKCVYDFTPAWFTDAKVNNMTVRWNSDSVKSCNTKFKEDNYLTWNKKYMSKGSKITAKVKYDKSAFSALDTNKQKKYGSSSNYNWEKMEATFGTIILLIVIISCMGGMFGGGGYYGHRGFYGGYGPRYYGGGCVRSSCACAHSSCASSCACACAGSGRAGCSKKDFYGTNITSNKIKKVMKK